MLDFLKLEKHSAIEVIVPKVFASDVILGRLNQKVEAIASLEHRIMDIKVTYSQ
jgi:hypothetical protein